VNKTEFCYQVFASDIVSDKILDVPSFNNLKAQVPQWKSIESGQVILQPFMEPEKIHSYTQELANGRYTVAVKIQITSYFPSP
jgi:hypothetical protein